jgi:outer membrane protein assembly factor BamA
VQGIEVTGVPKPMASELESGLALNVRSGFLGTRRPRFSEEVLDQDRRRILLYLARRGYPHAEVETRIDARSRRRVHVIMEVAPGAAVHFGELGLNGLPPELETPAREALTRVRKGELFADDAVVEAKAAMEELLHDASFARSQVNDTLLLHDSATVALGLEIGRPSRACPTAPRLSREHVTICETWDCFAKSVSSGMMSAPKRSICTRTCRSVIRAPRR